MPGRSPGTITFAILGVAYGSSVTTGSGGAIDIACHSALMAVLLAAGAILWGGRTSSKSQSGVKEVNR